MEIFSKSVSAALIAVFVQNIVFERALGTNLLIYAVRKKDSVKWLSLLIFVTTGVSSVFAFASDKFLRSLLINAEFYSIIMPLIYIIIISAVYVLILLLSWKLLPKLFVKIRPYVHLSVFNCAVLGSLFISNKIGGTLLEYIVYGFCAGLSFLLAGFLVYIASSALDDELVPKPFRGLPVTLVYTGIVSLALYAFIGYSAAV